jgi:hypothetical protein
VWDVSRSNILKLFKKNNNICRCASGTYRARKLVSRKPVHTYLKQRDETDQMCSSHWPDDIRLFVPNNTSEGTYGSRQHFCATEDPGGGGGGGGGDKGRRMRTRIGG